MTHERIHIFVKWVVKPEHLSKVLGILQDLIPLSRAEAGNIAYHAYQANDNAQVIMLYEEYANQEALQAHKASAHYQQLVAEQIVPLLETREVSIVTPVKS